MLHSPQILTGRPAPITAATLATWNPLDKAAGITLSGGNLTATGNTAAFSAVRGTKSRVTTGLIYWEVTAVASTGVDVIGIENATATLAGAFPGSDANGIGIVNDGRILWNSTNPFTFSGFASPIVVCFALDLGHNKLWIRLDGGNWDNSGTDNPATNTGGLDLTSIGLAAGPYFPALSPNTSGDSYTANFGATAYAQAVPSGFGNW